MPRKKVAPQTERLDPKRLDLLLDNLLKYELENPGKTNPRLGDDLAQRSKIISYLNQGVVNPDDIPAYMGILKDFMIKSGIQFSENQGNKVKQIVLLQLMYAAKTDTPDQSVGNAEGLLEWKTPGGVSAYSQAWPSLSSVLGTIQLDTLIQAVAPKKSKEIIGFFNKIYPGGIQDREQRNVIKQQNAEQIVGELDSLKKEWLPVVEQSIAQQQQEKLKEPEKAKTKKELAAEKKAERARLKQEAKEKKKKEKEEKKAAREAKKAEKATEKKEARDRPTISAPKHPQHLAHIGIDDSGPPEKKPAWSSEQVPPSWSSEQVPPFLDVPPASPAPARAARQVEQQPEPSNLETKRVVDRFNSGPSDLTRAVVHAATVRRSRDQHQPQPQPQPRALHDGLQKGPDEASLISLQAAMHRQHGQMQETQPGEGEKKQIKIDLAKMTEEKMEKIGRKLSQLGPTLCQILLTNYDGDNRDHRNICLVLRENQFEVETRAKRSAPQAILLSGGVQPTARTSASKKTPTPPPTKPKPKH